MLVIFRLEALYLFIDKPFKCCLAVFKQGKIEILAVDNTKFLNLYNRIENGKEYAYKNKTSFDIGRSLFFLFSFVCFVIVNDIQILIHIKTVRTAVPVNFVASVIHRKSDERIVLLPIL